MRRREGARRKVAENRLLIPEEISPQRHKEHEVRTRKVEYVSIPQPRLVDIPKKFAPNFRILCVFVVKYLSAFFGFREILVFISSPGYAQTRPNSGSVPYLDRGSAA